MDQVITRQTTGAPPVATPELARLTAVMRNRLEAAGTTKTGADLSSISSQNAPTEPERRTLARRSAALADALAPRLSDRENVADAILEMFYAWPDTRRMDAGKAAATASKYAATVSDLPLWAVKQASEQLTREDRDFPPSAGTLRAVTMKACSAARDELTDLRRILTAEVYTPTAHGTEAIERVRQVAKGFKERAAGFEPFQPGDYREHPDAEAERQLADFDVRRGVGPVDHSKPVSASPSLLAAIRRG